MVEKYKTLHGLKFQMASRCQKYQDIKASRHGSCCAVKLGIYSRSSLPLPSLPPRSSEQTGYNFKSSTNREKC